MLKDTLRLMENAKGTINAEIIKVKMVILLQNKKEVDFNDFLIKQRGNWYR